MEEVQEETNVEITDLPQRDGKASGKRTIAVTGVIIFSLLVGLLGGFLGSYLYSNSSKFKDTTSNLLSTKVTLTETSAVVDAVNKVKPAVVSITGTSSTFSYFGSSASEVSGTGYIVDSSGVIVTNKHVISGANDFTVITNEGTQYKATVKATDPVYDIAILKVDAKNLPTVVLGSSEKLQVGSTVIAIGNALGQYQNSVTTGVVSGVGRTIQASDSTGSSTESLDNVIQTDAAINSGNSGGPLVNALGQVIGTNTAVDSEGQGIGFAIPVDLVKSALSSYLAKDKIVRPVLGVRYIPITKELARRNDLPVTAGAYIYGSNGASGITSGSPAEKAGLKNGDIITMLADEKITETKTLVSLINTHNVGDSVKVTYLREGKTYTVNIVLGSSS